MMSSEKNTAFRLRLSTKASKYLLRINKKTAERLLNKMEVLKQYPLSAKGIKPLAGKFSGLFRLRIGDYRVIYQIGGQACRN